MAPKGARKIMKQVMIPTNKELEGRALAVWYSRGLFDMCIITVHCPLGDRDPNNHNKTKDIWHWVASVHNKLPRRTRIIIGTDANGHIGSTREYTSPVADINPDLLTDNTEYPHVGPHGADTENPNGTLLLEFLEKADMVAVNTWCPYASGKTWSGGKTLHPGWTLSLLTDSITGTKITRYYPRNFINVSDS